MTCKNCGMEQEEGVAFCTSCGAPMTAEVPVPQKPAEDPGKTMGLVSLIVGIASIVLGNFAASVVGIILSSLAQKKSAAAGYQNKSAKIGLILSIVGIVVGIAAFIFGFALGLFGGLMESAYYY